MLRLRHFSFFATAFLLIQSAHAQQRPPCTMTIGISYWNGSGWQIVNIASNVGGDKSATFGQGLKAGLHIPFTRGGLTHIIVLDGPAAPLSLSPKPIFCARIPAKKDPSALAIGTLDVKNGNRELVLCTGACAAHNPNDWIAPKYLQSVEITRTSDSTVEFTPRTPLPSGQYIMGAPPIGLGMYDFAVAELPAVTH